MEYLTTENVIIAAAILLVLVVLFGRETVKGWVEAVWRKVSGGES